MIPVHQWTNGGDRVLLVRFADRNGRSYDGFQWPSEIGSIVTAPDWRDDNECGYGLHGWPWGIGIGDGKDPVFTDAIWQVVSVEPGNVRLLGAGPKVKAQSVRLEYVGSWWGALAKIERGRDAWITATANGNAAASGVRGNAAASGERGNAAASGVSGNAAASGVRGNAAASGWSGNAAASGWRGIAVTSGEHSTVECGATGIAASTADRVTWVYRTGAIFIHRWSSQPGGFKICTNRRFRVPLVDGERITFECGRIVGREKPAA